MSPAHECRSNCGCGLRRLPYGPHRPQFDAGSERSGFCGCRWNALAGFRGEASRQFIQIGDKPNNLSVVGLIDKVPQRFAPRHPFRDIAEDRQTKSVVCKLLNDLPSQARAEAKEVIAQSLDRNCDHRRFVLPSCADERVRIAFFQKRRIFADQHTHSG